MKTKVITSESILSFLNQNQLSVLGMFDRESSPYKPDPPQSPLLPMPKAQQSLDPKQQQIVNRKDFSPEQNQISSPIQQPFSRQMHSQQSNKSVQKSEAKRIDAAFDMSQMAKQLDLLCEEEEKKLAFQENYEDLQKILSELGICQDPEVSQFDHYKLYRQKVCLVIEGKHEEQKNYPNIPFQIFKQIMSVWEWKKENRQKILPGSQYLKLRHLQRLKQRAQLNDEVISEYILLLNQQPQNKEIKILNSLQTASLFQNPNHQKTIRFLQKQGWSSKGTLLMAIHRLNHWIFVKLSSENLSIYDSMPYEHVKKYLCWDIIKNIANFSEEYHGKTPLIKLIKNFPCQENGYDCGVMMLLGMKDVLNGRIVFTFQQSDIPYQRILITKELLQRKLVAI